LSADAIRHAVASARRSLALGPDVPLLGSEVEIHARIGSTNDEVHDRALAGAAAGLAVFAEAQTLGRGRGGNRWTAPPGHDLLLSVLLRPSAPPEHWPRLAHAAGLAVARAVDPWLPPGTRALLKWPNDVLVSGRKLAGILLEWKGPRAAPHLILGMGVNVNSRPEDFPAELRDGVASVRSAAAPPLDRNHLAGILLAELAGQCHRALTDFPSLRDEIRSRNALLGRDIRFRRGGRWEEGTFVDLGPEGEMMVRHLGTGRTEAVTAAEQVRLREESP
jgi:BirA family biotin operon repressor/biotin-[acetyl-CoA-carboxylase] ligase